MLVADVAALGFAVVLQGTALTEVVPTPVWTHRGGCRSPDTSTVSWSQEPLTAGHRNVKAGNDLHHRVQPLTEHHPGTQTRALRATSHCPLDTSRAGDSTAPWAAPSTAMVPKGGKSELQAQLPVHPCARGRCFGIASLMCSDSTEPPVSSSRHRYQQDSIQSEKGLSSASSSSYQAPGFRMLTFLCSGSAAAIRCPGRMMA